MTGIVRATAADAGVLCHVIAGAFFHLPPSRWLIGDPDARRQVFPGYFRLLVDQAMAAGVVHTTTDRAGVALWLPVSGQPSQPPADYQARLRAATGPWASRFLAFDAALEHSHPAGVAHHHLAILAVRPGCQGRGTGTALLRHHHAELDQAGTPAYLEATSLRVPPPVPAPRLRPAGRPDPPARRRASSLAAVARPPGAAAMTDTMQHHEFSRACPLSCLEGELPPRTFNALKRHLRWRHSGHPTVGHVADLHQQGRLIDIRGLGVGGIERIGGLLESAGLRADG